MTHRHDTGITAHLECIRMCDITHSRTKRASSMMHFVWCMLCILCDVYSVRRLVWCASDYNKVFCTTSFVTHFWLRESILWCILKEGILWGILCDAHLTTKRYGVMHLCVMLLLWYIASSLVKCASRTKHSGKREADHILIDTWDLTHMYVRHGTFICVTWLIHMCDMTHSNVWHDPFTCVTWLIHMCDMTHSYVWHDSFTCVTWPIDTCDMTHWYLRHDSFVCATWLIHMCAMTHLFMWHGTL